MSPDSIVVGEDYRFTTEGWYEYTGRQHVVAALVGASLVIAAEGYWLMFDAIRGVIVDVPGGVVVAGSPPTGPLLAGLFMSVLGLTALVRVVWLWPTPSRYGKRIDRGAEA